MNCIASGRTADDLSYDPMNTTRRNAGRQNGMKRKKERKKSAKRRERQQTTDTTDEESGNATRRMQMNDGTMSSGLHT